MPEKTTVRNVMNASAPVVAKAPVAEPPQGSRPNRLQPTHEEEHGQQVRHEAIGVVPADGGPGHFVANENDHRLEQVRQSALAADRPA